MGIYTTYDRVARLVGIDPSQLTQDQINYIEELIKWAEDEIDYRLRYSWKTHTLDDYEYHDVPVRIRPRTARIMIPLNFRPIQKIDKLEVWNGSEWEDWTDEEGRNSSWWADYERGVIYIRLWISPWILWEPFTVRVKYTWGKGKNSPSEVPGWVVKVATLLAGVRLAESLREIVLLPEGMERIDLSSKADKWREEAEEILSQYDFFRPIELPFY